jgi:chloramphenicol-sensitive protein RarD
MFVESLSDRRRILLLTLTASLLSANWLAFIFAVQNKLIVQASLGYFITPLFNVVLGRIFLKERLRPIQQLAFALVCCGVLTLVVQAHQIPWMALFVAATFSMYGLLRKIAPVEALIGLSIENLVLSPIALGYLLYCSQTHELALFKNPQTDLLIPLTGPITAVPLISFAMAAKQLRLSTLGFFQYLAPTIQLLLAIFAYNEPFTGTHMIAFGLIWCALGIYLIDSSYAAKANAKPTAPATA